jgi:bacteriocin-like protein
MKKTKPTIKRATLDVKRLQELTETTLKKVTGGIPGLRNTGGNSYWN